MLLTAVTYLYSSSPFACEQVYLYSSGYILQVDDLLSSVEKIDIEVRSLETCSYNSQTFRDVLGKVQKAVDELNLHSYSNLPQWVATLDLQVK